ncbi:antigen peptide transporter 1 [Thamnophis elegans]|uniref:antigen peptide transporter 1 n=1 Tax=Thamnophis elegans TaxID=35005 RepID=UPI001377A224|nr:antigen peptide transporter 1 [Thamnophis elegans]
MKSGSWSWVALGMLLDFLALHLSWKWSPSPWGNPLAFLWAVAVGRCVSLVLAGGTLASSSADQFPWRLLLQGALVLSFQMPGYVSLQYLYEPQGNALHLASNWGRSDVLALNYLVVGAVMLLCHNLLSWGGTGSEKASSASFGRLISCLRPEALRFVAITVLMVISCMGEMAVPYYTGRVTDLLISKEEASTFTNALYMMACFTLASATTEFLCDFLYNTVMNRFHTRFQGSVFRSVLRQEIGFFSTNRTGDIASHISSGIDTMSEALSHDLSLVMWYLLRGICYYAMMLWISVPLATFVIVTMPFILLLPKCSGKFYQNLAMRVQESLAKANEVAMETFQAISTVRSFANEDGAAQCYEKKLQETYKLNKVEAVAYGASIWIPEMLQLALKVGILSYGGHLVTQGKLTGGALVTFVLQETELSTVVRALLSSYPSVQKAVGSSEKAFEYMDRTPQIKPSGTLAPTHLEGKMELKDVSFSYPNNGNSLVLKGVSLELRPGTVTALVGPSGSGKSTVVALLQRFYEPKEGEVLLDGKKLSEYEHHFLHQKVALVSQNPVLFARSLGANVAYGLEEQSQEKVTQASQLVGVHRFIATMSQGYNTNAGEAGKQISGGQKQGIALARALIRNPKVLILDDANSALDTESQKQLENEIYGKARKTRTVLLISHRLRSVKQADLILFMEDGEIREKGTYEELEEEKGLFWQMLQKQPNGAEGGWSSSPDGNNRN